MAQFTADSTTPSATLRVVAVLLTVFTLADVPLHQDSSYNNSALRIWVATWTEPLTAESVLFARFNIGDVWRINRVVKRIARPCFMLPWNKSHEGGGPPLESLALS